MNKKEILTRSAFLKTTQKLPNSLLATGKICNEQRENLCYVFYLIEVSSPWNAASQIKKAIVDNLKNSYQSGLADEKQFEETLNDINESLNKIASKGEKSWIGNLNSVIGLVYKNEIYLTQSGKISGYIFRKNKVSELTEHPSLSTSPHPLKTFTDITAGVLINEDKIFFGNNELYNHVSLDRIRKAVEENNPKETLYEFYKYFKRNKIYNVNSLIIEALDPEKLQNETVSEIPETLVVDDPEDTVFNNLRKKIQPKLQDFSQRASKQAKIIAKNAHTGSKNIASKSRKNWQENYGPKTHNFIKNTAPVIDKFYTSTKTKISKLFNNLQKTDNLSKVRTKNYKSSSRSSFSSVLDKFILYIKNLIIFFGKKQNRKYLYLLLIFIFISFGYLKIRANNSNNEEVKKEQEIALSYDKAKDIFETAKENIALGKTEGNDQLKEALALAQKAQELPQNQEKAITLTREIQKSLDDITKTTRIYDPSPIFSLGENVKHITIAGSEIYGIDSEGKIFKSNINDKESRLIASIGKENGTAVDLSYSDSEDSILIYTDQNKIINFDLNTETQKEVKNSASDKWEDAKSLDTYVSNIYLLDSESGILWKHSKSSGEYSAGSSYISKSEASIQGAIDIAIDGNIYVLQNNGSVDKFTRGTKDSEFSVRNIPSPNQKIEIPVKMYTNSDTNHIYISDSKLNRIVKIDKSGEFHSQFTIDGVEIEDFVVNDKIRKMWTLSKGNIYEISY